MKKIVTFSWVDVKLFEKYHLNIRHNDVIEAPDNLAIEVAMVQAKKCFEAGLNVMISRIPERDIIWVAVDDKKFTQR